MATIMAVIRWLGDRMAMIMAIIWSIVAVGCWVTDRKIEALLCLILAQGERRCGYLEKLNKAHSEKLNKKQINDPSS